MVRKPAALALLLVLIPFVWGLGMIGSAIILTFKRGRGIVGSVSTAINMVSEAYFPISLLPDWIQSIAEKNPIGLAYEGSRQALLGGATLSDVGEDVLAIGGCALAALIHGQTAGNVALARE